MVELPQKALASPDTADLVEAIEARDSEIHDLREQVRALMEADQRDFLNDNSDQLASIIQTKNAVIQSLQSQLAEKGEDGLAKALDTAATYASEVERLREMVKNLEKNIQEAAPVDEASTEDVLQANKVTIENLKARIQEQEHQFQLFKADGDRQAQQLAKMTATSSVEVGKLQASLQSAQSKADYYEERARALAEQQAMAAVAPSPKASSKDHGITAEGAADEAAAEAEERWRVREITLAAREARIGEREQAQLRADAILGERKSELALQGQSLQEKLDALARNQQQLEARQREAREEDQVLLERSADIDGRARLIQEREEAHATADRALGDRHAALANQENSLLSRVKERERAVEAREAAQQEQLQLQEERRQQIASAKEALERQTEQLASAEEALQRQTREIEAKQAAFREDPAPVNGNMAAEAASPGQGANEETQSEGQRVQAERLSELDVRQREMEESFRTREAALAARESDLPAQAEALRARELEVTARENEIAPKMERFYQGEADLAARSGTLLAHEDKLRALHADLAAREEKFARLAAQIEEAQLRETEVEQLRLKEAGLADREAALRAREDLVQQRGLDLEAKLNEVSGQAGGQEDLLRGKKEHLAEREARLLANEETMQQRGKQLEAKLRELSGHQGGEDDQLRHREAQLEAREAGLLAQEAELQKLSDQRLGQEDQLRHREQQVVDREGRLVAQEEKVCEKELMLEAKLRELSDHQGGEDDQLRHREAQLEAREAGLLAQEAELGELSGQRMEQESQLRQREERLADRESRMLASEEQLRERELDLQGKVQQQIDGASGVSLLEEESKHLAAREASAAAQEQILADRAQEAEDRMCEQAKLEQDQEQRQQRLNAREEAIVAREEATARIEQAQMGRQQALEDAASRAHVELEEKTRDNEVLEAKLSSTSAELEQEKFRSEELRRSEASVRKTLEAFESSLAKESSPECAGALDGPESDEIGRLRRLLLEKEEQVSKLSEQFDQGSQEAAVAQKKVEEERARSRALLEEADRLAEALASKTQQLEAARSTPRAESAADDSRSDPGGQEAEVKRSQADLQKCISDLQASKKETEEARRIGQEFMAKAQRLESQLAAQLARNQQLAQQDSATSASKNLRVQGFHNVAIRAVADGAATGGVMGSIAAVLQDVEMGDKAGVTLTDLGLDDFAIFEPVDRFLRLLAALMTVRADARLTVFGVWALCHLIYVIYLVYAHFV